MVYGVRAAAASTVSNRWANTLERSMEAYHKRAQLANSKIKVLAEKVAMLKQLEVAKALEKEKDLLRSENDILKNEIENLKIRLIIAEIRNGKPQVALPIVQTTVQQEQAATKVSKVAATTTEGKTEQPQPKKPKAEKPKKKSAPPMAKGDEAVVDVSRLDLRVARIVTAERHPDADTLYIEDVETGEEKNRTVISGLVKHIPIEEMQNRMVVLMMNLKPAKMRGIMSQAMVMCASSPEKVEILAPPPGSVPGDRVTFEGYPGEPDKQLNPKKKVWEQVQPDLKTDSNKVACYKGVPFTVKGKGVVTSQTMANSAIK